MFGFRKKVVVQQYDKNTQKPVIRASICTGEQVAGFRDKETGKFHEIMLLRGEDDKNYFMRKYGVSEDEIVKEY